MTLTDLASVGSFISGIAVVITLVLLLIQLRQTNKNQRTLMQQGRSVRTVDLIAKMTEPHLSEIIVRAERNDLTLESPEVQAYVRHCAAWLYSWKDSYLQHQAGTLDVESWETDLAALKVVASIPGFRVAWKFGRAWTSATYRDFVDGLLRDTKVEQRSDYSTLWKTWMAEELAAMKSPAAT